MDRGEEADIGVPRLFPRVRVGEETEIPLKRDFEVIWLYVVIVVRIVSGKYERSPWPARIYVAKETVVLAQVESVSDKKV